MNLYHCMIELKSGAKALHFSAAVDQWMGHLADQGMIAGWRLFRRKFGLSSGQHSDFILEIEVDGMSQLEDTFRRLGQGGDMAERRYDQLHQMIGKVEIGLYRPYPDPENRERIALI
jgi:hypothetical protein